MIRGRDIMTLSHYCVHLTSAVEQNRRTALDKISSGLCLLATVASTLACHIIRLLTADS